MTLINKKLMKCICVYLRVSSNFMRTYNLTILSILPLVLVTSCKPNYEKIFKDNNDNFELHRPTLNKVIKDIETKYISNWSGQEIIILVDSLNEQTKNVLEDLGIGSIEIESNPADNCRKKYWIILNVIDEWNIGTLRVVQLIYAPCDKKAEKNYHYYDGYHRNFWGQGDNWFIYSDTDFI